MLCDHAGLVFFPDKVIFRIIGRLAFPIFAYMIAEGCKYTKNRLKYFLQVAVLGVICSAVYLIFLHSWHQNILITFTLSIALIFAVDYFLQKKNFLSCLIMVITVLAVIFISVIVPEVIKFKDFNVDSSYIGLLIPVIIYYVPKKWLKLVALALALTLLTVKYQIWYQFYSLISVLLLALYNGTRGKANLKYLFYLFYPIHLVVIYGIQMLIIYLKYYS